MPARATPCHPGGYTLMELVIALAIGAILVAGLGGVLGRALQVHDGLRDRNDLTRQARFAMQRMVRAVGHSRRLLLPLDDKSSTNWPEHIREQTVPASPPVGSSTLATAVLAVTLPTYSDLDGDAFADADNDRDGRIDEDLPSDSHNDSASGIYQIDDGGGGFVDESTSSDDDEYFFIGGEDPINGTDDDGDGNIDEDPSADMNGDGLPGVSGLDDDGDGQLDEGNNNDDDEDGQTDEDWYDPLVFYLNGSELEERTPVPWDESGDGSVSGRDFVVQPIAENVTRLRVERIPLSGRATRVDLILELTSPVSGETVRLHTQVRVGGAL